MLVCLWLWIHCSTCCDTVRFKDSVGPVGQGCRPLRKEDWPGAQRQTDGGLGSFKLKERLWLWFPRIKSVKRWKWHQGEEELQLRTFSKQTANYVVHQAAVKLRHCTLSLSLICSWLPLVPFFFKNRTLILPIILFNLLCLTMVLVHLVKLPNHFSRGLQHLEVPAVPILSLWEAPQRDKERQRQAAWLCKWGQRGWRCWTIEVVKTFSSCLHLKNVVKTIMNHPPNQHKSSEYIYSDSLNLFGQSRPNLSAWIAQFLFMHCQARSCGRTRVSDVLEWVPCRPPRQLTG